MPIGYLIGLVIAAIPVAILLLPDRLPWSLRRRIFVVTMTYSELPLYVLGLFVLSSSVAVVEDGLLASPPGWVVFALACAVAIGLLELIRRALQARMIVDEALAESPYGPPPARSAWWGLRHLLLPIPVRPRAVERIRGVAYGPDPAHKLDIYRRRGHTGEAPVLVFMHAGGYSSGGRRREGRALFHRMAARGWVCVSADYRLRPRATWPDHLVDAKRAIAWLRTEGRAHGIEPSHVVFSGSSAGAHLASMCAVLPYRGDLQPGFESVDTRIDAAVCLYGYYDRYFGLDGDHDPPSSSFDVDASGAPPVFVVHGDRDGYVPVSAARRYVRHLRGSSRAPVVYAELPSGEHGFDTFVSARGAAVVDGIGHFLSGVVRGNSAG